MKRFVVRRVMMNSLVDWVNIVLIIVLGLVFFLVWTSVIYRGLRKMESAFVVRAMNSFVSLAIWLVLILIQLLMPMNTKVYANTLFIGYFVLVFSLISLWRLVLFQTSKQMKELFKVQLYRRFFVGVSLVYALFYLFATGMITKVDSATFSQPGITMTDSFGPLTIWPTMELFFPNMTLFATISVGTILIMITITGLTGIGLTLLFYRWQQNKKDVRSIGRTAGISFIIPIASFSCCSLPLFYPLIVLFIGTTAAESVTALLMDWTGVLFNLIQVTIFSFLVITIGSITKQMHKS